ncbi:uncharacterized protein K02A2.6-like [Teleopsis dalmanni]|uniref:uncharacterized protein K02A2.6-like n=1 Tax=Teleopsis dalmanni TaxID=139649 RepID=UPI0018CEBD9A|nr:uncharacterized protein K02A2.6-like [Teleopsis dalmanni]
MAAARMRRWAFIMTGFNYKIEYVKGHLNHADNLSRIPQTHYDETMNDNHDDDESYIYSIQEQSHLNLNFKNIAQQTRRDPILSKVSDAVLNGTINNLKGNQFTSFTTKSIELTVDRGCLLWGYRIVIPQKLRQSVLHKLHESHLGVVKTKSIARSYVWWPNIDVDVENLIKTCIPCQELLASPEKSTLIPWTPTDTVWSRVHIDFAGVFIYL